MRACNSSGCSGYQPGGNPITVLLPPGVPSSISVPSVSYNGNYTISWAASGTATSYQLHEATNPGFSGESLVYNAGGLSTGIPGRGNGTYYYRVRACNGSGCSGYLAGGNGVTVSRLQVSVSSTYWNWYGVRTGDTYEAPAVVVTTSGGAGGNTYLWERLSGDTAAFARQPNSSVTAWGGSTWREYYVDYISFWRCRVTDSAGNVVYSPDVQVHFRSANDPE